MKTCVVVTNATGAEVHRQIRDQLLPRVDYLELAARPGVDYVDYSAVGRQSGLEARLEATLRLDLRLARHVAARVRQGNYAVVLSLSERAGIPLAALLPRGVRHIVYLHHPLSPAKLLLLRLCRAHTRWDLALTLSQAERERFRAKLRLPDEAVACLPYHVDTTFFTPSPPSPHNEGPGDYLLSVGLSHRDYPTLIQAMRLLPALQARCYIGSNWATGGDVVQEAALPANVKLYPYVPPRELREVYRASRFVVVVLRADTQWSAGCTTLLQAQAMGKPVIVTRRPGITEYVLDGETGVVVEPGDARALAAAIRALWDDPARVARMGRQAREWVAEHFSLDRWLGAIDTLILPPGSRPRGSVALSPRHEPSWSGDQG